MDASCKRGAQASHLSSRPTANFASTNGSLPSQPILCSVSPSVRKPFFTFEETCFSIVSANGSISKNLKSAVIVNFPYHFPVSQWKDLLLKTGSSLTAVSRSIVYPLSTPGFSACILVWLQQWTLAPGQSWPWQALETVVFLGLGALCLECSMMSGSTLEDPVSFCRGHS